MTSFSDLFNNLEELEFVNILGYDDLYYYLQRFPTARKQCKFLEFILGEMHSNNVLIHPDSVDDACYLGRFRDPTAIQILFTITVPRVLSELKPTIQTRKKEDAEVKFQLKKVYSEIKDFESEFIKILKAHKVFKEDLDVHVVKALFKSENFFKSELIVQFGWKPLPLILFFDTVFSTYYQGFSFQSLERCKSFLNHAGNPFLARDLGSASHRHRKRKDKTKKTQSQIDVEDIDEAIIIKLKELGLKE